jgi:hypothetical protein
MRGVTRAIGPSGGGGGELPIDFERDDWSRLDGTPRSFDVK